jgi:hypothetical protein
MSRPGDRLPPGLNGLRGSRKDDETVDRRIVSSGKKSCLCTNHYLRTRRADLIMAWLQRHSTRERPDTFTQLSSSSCPRTLHGRGGPYIFCQQVLQRRIVEHGVRQELLQPGVLVLQPPQALGLRDLKPTVLGLPVVEARLADPVLAAQIGRLNPGLAPSGSQ